MPDSSEPITQCVQDATELIGTGRPEAASDVLQPGEVLGGCVIDAFIARGGMGDVYKARKVSLSCDVAVKVLQPALVARGSVRTRFFREAKVAASLTHPSIVKVYDVGEDQGRYFIVMEFVNGRDLRDIVNAEGPLSVNAALRIARQIAEALDHAHTEGVIHRDVKPANILLAADGTAKLTDMGLARPACQDSEVTAAGEVVGTPVYMSPEQYRGHSVDARSDIYSLGATLYMLLSGKAPFGAETTAQVLHQVLNERPASLQALSPEIPDKVVGLVQRLMAKHPVARLQTGREVVRAIDEVLKPRISFASDAARDDSLPQARAFPDVLKWVAVVTLGVGLTTYAYFALPTAGTSAASRSTSSGQAARTARPADGSVVLRAQPHADGHPEGSQARATAAPPDGADPWEVEVGDADLCERIKGIRRALRSGIQSELFQYFHPSQREDKRLMFSLGRVLDLLKSEDLRPGVPIIRRKDADNVLISLLYANSRTGHSIGLPLEWTRIDGEWYVKPLATR